MSLPLEQPEGVRYWVTEDHDYYARFAWVVMDGPIAEHTPVAGFPKREAARSYADYLNDHDYSDYDYTPPPPGYVFPTVDELNAILEETYIPAMREELNSKSLLITQIQKSGKRSLLDRILHRKKSVTFRNVS